MTDVITKLFGPGDEGWNASHSDAKRQAISSLRGYAYQLHQSLAAWIALPDNGTLHLEISEDYAQIARDPTTLDDVLTATQVKETRESGSVTLNSPDVLEAIKNYWALHCANPGRRVRFIFLTTSPIGMERKEPLSTGEKALEVWNKGSLGASVNALRAGLLARFDQKAGTEPLEGLRTFLSQSDDETFHREIVSPIRWICGAPDMTGVAADNRAAIVVLGQSLGGTPDLSARAAHALLTQILTTIVDSDDRRLRRGELIEALHSAVTVRVPAHQALLGLSRDARGLDLDATGAWRITPSPKGRYAPRQGTVTKLRGLLNDHGAIWIHGATGLGKSLLAELVSYNVGGVWRTLDLRSTTGPAAQERLVAARLAILVDPNIAGIVIDDLPPALESDVETVLLELSQTLARRQLPLLITSNNPPSHRLGRVLALQDHANYPAPDFDINDAAALVDAYGGNAAQWAHFALGIANSHPQLVDVVVAGLERRGWPDSTMRDWIKAGMINPDIEAEREAARRRLLSELTPDSLGFLARTVRIYGIFDRELARAVGSVNPAISGSGLLLDQLAGLWIERVGSVGLRPSPLIGGLDRETLDEDLLKKIDIAIVTHIYKRKPVDGSLLDTGFYHAWLAKDEAWITFMVRHFLEVSDEDRAKLASAVPLMREAPGDLGFLADRPFVILLLRLAQHLLKTSIGTDEQVVISANRLCEHLDAMTGSEAEFEVRHSTLAMVLFKLLLDVYGHGRIPNWFSHLRKLARIAKDDPDFRGTADQVKATSGADPIGFIFIAHAARLPGIAALDELLSELDTLPAEERIPWLEAMRTPSAAMAMIIDNAWLKDSQREPIDGRTQASAFQRFAEMALRWGETRLAGRCYRTQALLLDEYLKDRVAAYASLDAAEALLPENFDIIRERGKISWHNDDYARAYKELSAIENRMEETEPYDAAFALREAAICAGETGQWEEATRLFDKARTFACMGVDDKPGSLSIGLAVDGAAARYRSGDRVNGVRAMAAVLEELVFFDPEESRVARSVYLIACHFTLWMRIQTTPIEVDEEKTQFYIGAASNPNPNPAIVGLPLPPLASSWMLLTRAALDVGISSDEVLGWQGLIAARADPQIDGMIRYDLLASAIESVSLDNFLRFLMPAIEYFEYSGKRAEQTSPLGTQIVSAGTIPSLAKNTQVSASVTHHIRVAAITFGLVLQAENSSTDQDLIELHANLKELVGSDVMPEWSYMKIPDQNDGISIVAWYIKTLNQRDIISLDDLFKAHLRALDWAEQSNYRDVVLAKLQKIVRRTWAEVIQHRKAMLISPKQNVPQISGALTIERPAAAYIAAVLLAVEPALSINLSTEFRAKIQQLKNGELEQPSVPTPTS